MEEIKKQLLEGEEEEQEELENSEPTPAADGTSPLENETPAPENENPAEEQPAEEAPASEPAENEPAPEEPGLSGYGTIAAEPASDSIEGEIATPAQPDLVEENGAIETSIKTFTQDDVDKLVGDTRVKTREKTFRYIYDRYGVKNEDELDSLVANAQRYDTQKEMYDTEKANWESERSDTDKRLSEMSEQIALMQSQIDPERYEDAKLILKGKGLEVSLENIEAELATHPEWKKEEPVAPAPAPAPEMPKPTMRIKALGNEQKPAPELSEEEEAQKIFKMKW